MMQEKRKLLSIFLLVLLTATTLTSLGMTAPVVSSGSSNAVEDEEKYTPLSGAIESDSTSANFTCKTFSYGLDTDGNELYDYLVVDVEVNITDAGLYIVRGDGLLDDYGGYVDVWDEEMQNFDPGTYNVSLMFPGGPMYNSEKNVTKISGIYLFDQYYGLLDDKHDVALGRQYNYTEFDVPSHFTCRVFDWGLDKDSDGLYNYLFVDVEVNITDAGLYIVVGNGLLDDYGGYVDVWDEVYSYFDPGTYNVTLMLLGGPIYGNGKNVTKISGIQLFDKEGYRLDEKYGVPLSRQYNYTEFDPVTHFTCRVFDQGLDTDGNGLYDWLEIKVELDVIESDTYHVSIEGLIDSDGHYLWFRNETGVNLDPGLHNVTILLYGPRIAYERFSPLNITRITLQGEHQGYGLGKDNVPLSREYSYTEFDAPFSDYDVRLIVYPDGRVETEGTMNATHMLEPPGITWNLDYNILEFEDGFWWCNGSSIFYLPKIENVLNPEEFPFNSTYFSYYEYLLEGINYGEMNLTMFLPPAYEDIFPLNATDLELISTFDGSDFEESIHGTLIGNLTNLFTTLLDFSFGFNETVDLPLHLLLDYDKGEYNGTLTIYLMEGLPIKLLDIDIDGNLSSICLNGSLDVVYGIYGPPIDMEINYEWLNAMLTGLNEMLNETIYNMTDGTLECPIVDITLTNITGGATVSFKVCIQEVEEKPGVVLYWLMMPIWEMIELHPSEGVWLLNALNDTLNKIQDTTLELTYTPSTTTTEFWFSGTMHVRDILEQLLEPIVPPDWWPYEVPPEVNETVLPYVWALVRILNASVCSVEDSSIHLSYSWEEGRFDLNTTYVTDLEAMMEAMAELIPDLVECLPPMPEPVPQFYDIAMELLNGTYFNVTWFEMSMSYANGIYEEHMSSLMEGDLNAAANRIFDKICELVGESPDPPPYPILEFMNATDLDLSDFYINVAIEENSIVGGMRMAAIIPTDPINETSFKLTTFFNLFYGMPIPDSWSELSIRVQGGSNETHTVLVRWPAGEEPMPDVVDAYERFVSWENVSLCDISPLTFTLLSNSPPTILDPTAYPTSIYRVTQNVTISAVIVNDHSWETPERTEVYVNIKDPLGGWVNDTSMSFNGTHFEWSSNFEGKTAGNYTAIIRAVDLYGVDSESAPMSFRVMNNLPNISEITIPKRTVNVGENITGSVTASDVEGAISVNVSFHGPDGWHNVTTTLSGGVYIFSASTVGWSEGEYTVYALATDTDGETTIYEDPQKVTLTSPLSMWLILGAVGAVVLIVIVFFLMRRGRG